MKTLHAIILAAICIILTAFITIEVMHQLDTPNMAKAEALINTVTHNNVKILKIFPAVGNIEGFVLTTKTPSQQRGILYVDNAGRYVIDGSIINSAGQDIAQRDFSLYIEPSLSTAKVYQQLANTAWIAQGNPNAPHKVYIVVDPNCMYCHSAFEALQPYINSGTLAVRWIVTGIIKPSSKGKALAILTASNPLSALQYNEAHFNVQQEEGGITPLPLDGSVPMITLDRNLHFTETNQIIETPTLFYQTSAGQSTTQAGVPTDAKALSTLIAKMSDQFNTAAS